jgi:hypothetical protein
MGSHDAPTGPLYPGPQPAPFASSPWGQPAYAPEPDPAEERETHWLAQATWQTVALAAVIGITLISVSVALAGDTSGAAMLTLFSLVMGLIAAGVGALTRRQKR